MTRLPTTHRPFLTTVLCLAAVSCFSANAPEDANAGDGALQIAKDMAEASGAAGWKSVTRARFTVVHEVDGKPVRTTRHDWDLQAGTDTVDLGDRVVSVSLRYPLNHPDAHRAIHLWQTDTRWLLAPIGFVVGSGGPAGDAADPAAKGAPQYTRVGRKTAAGIECDVLEVSCPGEPGTPPARFRLYVDTASRLLRAWDDLTDPRTPQSFTWEDYDYFGPNVLVSTLHRGDGQTVRITNLSLSYRPPGRAPD